MPAAGAAAAAAKSRGCKALLLLFCEEKIRAAADPGFFNNPVAIRVAIGAALSETPQKVVAEDVFKRKKRRIGSSSFVQEEFSFFVVPP